MTNQTSKIRFESPDQFGRRAAYVFCPACQQEHSFGTVYPDGSVEVQFSDEFGISREDAEAMVTAAFKRAA